LNIKEQFKKIRQALSRAASESSPFGDRSNICCYTGMVCSKQLCDDCKNPNKTPSEKKAIETATEQVPNQESAPVPMPIDSRSEYVDESEISPESVQSEPVITYPWMGWHDIPAELSQILKTLPRPRRKRSTPHTCDYCGSEFAVPELSAIDLKGSSVKLERKSKEYYIPYICNYCGGVFCEEHRLPEQHNCSGLPPRSWDEYRRQSSG